MIEFAHVVGIVVLVIIILTVINMSGVCSESEHYDTYHNMDMAASAILQKPLDEAALVAKYNWNVRNPMGYNLQDLVFTETMMEKMDYKERFPGADYDLDNSYDQKFSLVPFYDYNVPMMREPQQTLQFRGQPIQLSQRLYW